MTLQTDLQLRNKEEEALMKGFPTLSQAKLQKMDSVQASDETHDVAIRKTSRIYNLEKPRSTKAINKIFRQRKANVMKKTHELGQLCQANVYLLVERDEKISEYSFTTGRRWPLNSGEIVRFIVSPYSRAKLTA
jgi:hypothetical protein